MRAAAGAVVLTALLGGTSALATPTSPLDEARRAAEETPFEGVLEVRWVDGTVARSEKLTVKSADSGFAVLGVNRVMAFDPFERLVSHRGAGWEAVWRATMGPTVRRPDGVGKYQVISLTDGPEVAGRRTTTLEIRQAGALRERLHLDTATKLPLHREQYDSQGAMTRALVFETLTVGAVDVPPHPSSSRDRSARPVSAYRTGSPVPDRLSEGYERMGVYRSGAVLQSLYSDGIYDLSVFQQPGRLRQADLPAPGERVAVGASTGRRYAWAGGQLVVWASGGKVFTAVSDAPLDQVLQAVRSLPTEPDRAPSLLGKLRRACKTLMEPLSS